MGRDFQNNTRCFSWDVACVQHWAVVPLIPSSCSIAFGLFTVMVSLFPRVKEPANLIKLEFSLTKPTVSRLYLCSVSVDHNSPAAAWRLGVARQAHRDVYLSDAPVSVNKQDNSESGKRKKNRSVSTLKRQGYLSSFQERCISAWGTALRPFFFSECSLRADLWSFTEALI